MTIEPNKHYRTRDGRRARVYATDGGGYYTIHGAIYMNGVWNPNAWNEIGGFVNGRNPQPADLIAEWIDAPVVDWPSMPAWAVCVAMDADLAWWCYANDAGRYDTRWNGAGAIRIPSTHAPHFTGDWKQSKAKRP